MEDRSLLPAGTPVDLTTCDREPIHIPGQIQPHGVLLALRLPELHIVQVSANSAAWLGQAPETLSGRSLTELLAPSALAELRLLLQGDQLFENPLYLCTTTLQGGDTSFDAIVHTVAGLLILELKPVQTKTDVVDAYREVRRCIVALQRTTTLDECVRLLVSQVRMLTGFDRVMVYRFQQDGTGVVIAEDHHPAVESFFGLHYPASDIPRQARALYLRNWLRFIPDAAYTPVALFPALNPLTGSPLDMTYTTLRSVSPIHIEYLVNMGVSASMSISLVVDHQLWGLIACHHCSGAHHLSYDISAACELLGRFVSTQIADLQHREDDAAIIQRANLHATLVERIATSSSLAEGFAESLAQLRTFVDSSGVAVSVYGRWLSDGAVPAPERLAELTVWLARQNEPLIATSRLAQSLAGFASETGSASGLLALALSPTWQTCVLWFRPEVIQTVTWGGDPAKPVELTDNGLRLSPRRSFAAWQEQVRGSALPWTAGELAAARALRAALVTILLHQAELLAQHAAELERSNAELEDFAYIASHDLREPLRGIHNYAGILVEDYADRLDPTGVSRLATLTRLTRRMEALIESLLTYSRVGRLDLAWEMLDLGELLAQTLEGLRFALEESGTRVIITQPLPSVRGDRVRVAEVLHNLISNALKYNDKAERRVEVGALPHDPAHDEASAMPPMVTLYVRDNGIGIAPDHLDEIFRLFRRLHARDAYGGGIGAGLTITRRIVERHGGQIRVESTVGQGTTFWFSLPAA